MRLNTKTSVVKKLFLIVLQIISFSVYSQPITPSQIRNHYELKVFTENLVRNEQNELEKARVIYDWITDHISYDIKKYNKGFRIEGTNCKKTGDCEKKIKENEIRILENVLRTGKAICSGYSLLFKKMCDYAGVKSHVIAGYIKTPSKNVGSMGIYLHAWNAIEIGHQTYYIDATWASGYCTEDKNGKLQEFLRLKNDFYWLTPVNKFTINHYPRYPQKVPNFHISRESYRNQPYIKSGYNPYVDLCFPQDGIISACLNDTIQFQFESTLQIESISIFSNLHKIEKSKEGKKETRTRLLKKVPFSQKNGIYDFKVIVEKPLMRWIEIYFDKELVMKFLVKVEE